MGYRDERDALRGRVDSLEESLASARKELELHRDDDRRARIVQLEARITDAREILQRLEQEIDEVRPLPAKTSPKRTTLWLALGATAMAITGAVFAVVASRAEPPPSPVVGPQEAERRPAPLVPSPEPKPVPTVEPPPASVTPERVVAATWKAKVTRSSGPGVAPAGSACTITASLSPKDYMARVQDVVVRCGDKIAFDSKVRLEGMSRSGYSNDERTREGGQVYTLDYEDAGPRTGKPQISLSTTKRSAVVWSDNAPPTRIELTVEEWSGLVEGEPLLASTKQTLRAELLVQEVTGPAGVKKGATCSLLSRPVAPDKCVSLLECKGNVLYGGEGLGFSPCTIADGVVSTLLDEVTSDQESDPAISVDVAKKSVVVWDVKNGVSSQIKLEIR